jgi:hypothetical protein
MPLATIGVHGAILDIPSQRSKTTIVLQEGVSGNYALNRGGVAGNLLSCR